MAGHGTKLKKFYTGCCNYPANACINHLIHIALHFHSDIPQVSLSANAMQKLLRAIGQIRGAYNTGSYITLDGEQDYRVVEWIEATPVFKAWLMSKEAFVAPAEWPGDVGKLFGFYGEVPTPYEVAGLRSTPQLHGNKWHLHEIAVLVAYCYGMSLDVMSEGMDVSHEHLITCMVQAVDKLVSLPQFALWCHNLDLRLVPLPPMENYQLNDRLELFETMKKHPFHLRTTDARAILSSPFFTSYAKLKLLPHRVEQRPSMGTPYVGPPRRKNDDQEKTPSRQSPQVTPSK
jgi:hypothetical protein